MGSEVVFRYQTAGGSSAGPWTVLSPDGGVFISSFRGTPFVVVFPETGTFKVQITFCSPSFPWCQQHCSASEVDQVVKEPCVAPSPLSLAIPSPLTTATTGSTVTYVFDGGTPGVLSWSIRHTDGGALTTGTGATAQVQFPDAGSYDVRVTAINELVPADCVLTDAGIRTLGFAQDVAD